MKYFSSLLLVFIAPVMLLCCCKDASENSQASNKASVDLAVKINRAQDINFRIGFQSVLVPNKHILLVNSHLDLPVINMPLDPSLRAWRKAQLFIGQKFFAEKSLSGSGKLSCSDCHTHDAAHASQAGVEIPMGGINLNLQGLRATPSLLYQDRTPEFTLSKVGPVGGFDWDGRANSRVEQALGPLFAVDEMANSSIKTVADKIRALSYFNDFKSAFILTNSVSDQKIYDTLVLALDIYQQFDSDYNLFNSKFDLYLDGEVALTNQEIRGMEIFKNPLKGNCDSCHTSGVSPSGERPLFSNFRFSAQGVPRNPRIEANKSKDFYDMGLCGPKRTDLKSRLDLCGQFKVPTLRNVAITPPYFHNSSVATLKEAVLFYATRDTKPAKWYPVLSNLQVDKFNDLPLALRGNVNHDRPFSKKPGTQPALSDQDVDDLVEFLQTLTDEHSAPQRPSILKRR